MKEAIFAGGCFWCVEAIFQRLEGVEVVQPGYIGGHTPHPTYKQVCSGKTGHAEAVRIFYQPSVISYDELLTVFWHLHNPTTLNRQGDDIGEQYRSAIFYLNDYQRKKAIHSMKESEKSGLWKGKYVTQITKATDFYLAEDYHHNYYNNNTERSYCSISIAPKVAKLHQIFKDRIKPQYQEQ